MQKRINADQLGSLLDAIQARGHQLVGPTVRDGAIVLDRITGVADLPRGYNDEQAPGRYRAVAGDSPRLFGHHAPAQTFRHFLQPSGERIFWARRDGPDGTLQIRSQAPAGSGKLALIGVKACDLAAIGVHDVVFGYRDNPRQPVPALADPFYAERREHLLLVATECASAGATCFCASMGSGPEIDGGYDLRLTEFVDDSHWFLVDAATAAGECLLAEIGGDAATDADRKGRDRQLAGTRHAMGRQLDTGGLAGKLAASLDSPRWDAIAERCLSCANCTLSCPTCFCTDIEDSTDITGREASRTRQWDSCFNKEISWMHGGHVRKSTASRYRQWLTHKLSTWHDQFGSSGCTGCGRCITWCPVGIDITAEASALAEESGS